MDNFRITSIRNFYLASEKKLVHDILYLALYKIGKNISAITETILTDLYKASNTPVIY